MAVFRTSLMRLHRCWCPHPGCLMILATRHSLASHSTIALLLDSTISSFQLCVSASTSSSSCADATPCSLLHLCLRNLMSMRWLPLALFLNLFIELLLLIEKICVNLRCSTPNYFSSSGRVGDLSRAYVFKMLW